MYPTIELLAVLCGYAAGLLGMIAAVLLVGRHSSSPYTDSQESSLDAPLRASLDEASHR